MSSIDLFILGFIKRNPMSAYDLATFVEKNHLKQMIKISPPAIYKNLVILNKKGFLKANDTKIKNNNPKKIYSITSKGDNYFKSLMRDFSQRNINIYFDFNSFIIGLDLIDKKEAFNELDDFKKVLFKKRKEYQRILDSSDLLPFSGQEIIKQFLKVNDILIEWLENFNNSYTKKNEE